MCSCRLCLTSRRDFSNCVSPNGFELGGGLFPAVFFAPIRTRDPRNQRSGEKERKKDESTEFKNVEQNWSLLSAQEVTTCGRQQHKKVNNGALAARVSYADRVRFPETNPGCTSDYGAVANPECNSGWIPGWLPDSVPRWIAGWPLGSLLGRHSDASMWELRR